MSNLWAKWAQDMHCAHPVPRESIPAPGVVPQAFSSARVDWVQGCYQHAGHAEDDFPGAFTFLGCIPHHCKATRGGLQADLASLYCEGGYYSMPPKVQKVHTELMLYRLRHGIPQHAMCTVHAVPNNSAASPSDPDCLTTQILLPFGDTPSLLCFVNDWCSIDGLVLARLTGL